MNQSHSRSEVVTVSTARIAAPVPPPVPRAALAARPRPFVRGEAIATIDDRDVVSLDDEGAIATRLLTFPPSPPIPRRPRSFSWPLFAAIVSIGSASMAAGAGTGWVSRAHFEPSRTTATLVLEAKPAPVAAVSVDPSASTPAHADAPAARPAATPPVAAAPVTAARAPVARRSSSSPSPAARARVIAPSTSDGPIPALPMDGAVAMAQQRVRGAIILCGMGVPSDVSTVDATVTYASSGSITRVTLSSPWAGTEPGRCMENAIRTRSTLPPFGAGMYRTTFSFVAQ